MLFYRRNKMNKTVWSKNLNQLGYMKKIIILLLFSILSNIGFSQSINQNIIDTIVVFPGDISFRVSYSDKIRRVEMWNDSSKTIKNYQLNTNLLYWAFQTDQYNRKNGYYYYLDTLKKNKAYAYYKHDTIIYSYTISINNDTIKYEKLLNDSTVYKFSKSDGELIIWLTNVKHSKNGYYKIIDLNTNLIKEYKEYRTIYKQDILDYENFIKKFNTYVGLAIFSHDYISIPVGTWIYYNAEGEVVKTVDYDWEGIFR